MKLNRFCSLIVLTSILSGCSQNDLVSVTPKETKSTSQIENIDTYGKLIPIQSNNVSAAGYNSISQTLTIQFHEGAIYEYYGVSIDIWIEFLQAQPHPWSQVGKPLLVDAGVPYQRISH